MPPRTRPGFAAFPAQNCKQCTNVYCSLGIRRAVLFGGQHSYASTVTEARPRKDAPQPPDGPDRAGVLDLLGLLAYGELTASQQLARDAAMAPQQADVDAMNEMAMAEQRHFEMLRERLVEHGVDPTDASAPFVGAIDEFHRRTAPHDWLEGLVKAYIGDGIANDFYREIGVRIRDGAIDLAAGDEEEETQRDGELVVSVCEDLGHSDFAIERVKRAIEEDPKVSGRLALWGRWLVGEALCQAEQVALERDSLTALLVGVEDPDFDEVNQVLSRLTQGHARRMSTLGLAS